MVFNESETKRNSPSPEKGQEDEKVREKTRKENPIFENPAFEIPGYEILVRFDDDDLDSHDYEMLDAMVAGKETSATI